MPRAYSKKLRMDFLRYLFTGRRVLNDMGATEPRLMISFCLNQDRRWWTVSAISNATGMARNTVRKELRRYTGMGVVERDPAQGWRLTDKGEDFICERFSLFMDKVYPELIRFHRSLHAEVTLELNHVVNTDHIRAGR